LAASIGEINFLISELTFKIKFPYISVTDEVSDFKFTLQLGFAKAHHQIPLDEEVGVALY